MEAAFEAVHGPGTCKQVNGLYSRLDALRDIGKKFSGASVLKPTPVDFLPKGVNDPRIIEGLGLRKVVSQLSEPTADYPRGAFDAAKIKPDVVLKLQELGSLLERSKVQDRSKIGFGRYSSATAGAASGLAGLITEGLLTHSLTGGGVAAGTAGLYGASKFLGHLMTNPEALEYTLRAARKLVGPAGVQATHIYNENTQSIEPVGTQQ